MDRLTRRETLLLGAGLATAAASPGVAAVPVADVPALSVKPEPGASLRVLRPAKFVDADERLFTENSAKYAQSAGVPVRVDYLAWDNMPAQLAVVANTGAGPDIVVGFGPDPHLYEEKLVELTDVADYLGHKYGGWYNASQLFGRRWKSESWIGLPMGGSGGPCNYRVSWVKEAGFEAIPNDLDQFLQLCRKLKANGHPCGFALSHAPGDAPNYANWLLWSHGGALVDANGQVTLDSKETRAAIDYAKAMQETMTPGTMSWNGASNNQAFAAGNISLTQNGVSIYYSAVNAKDPAGHAVAVDMNHSEMPRGAAKAPPEACLVLNAMLFKHSKYPNAAKDYLRFMMEAPQYDPWLTGSLGYWSQPLKAYAQSAVWTSDPKLAVFRDQMDTPFHDGYAGPVDQRAGAVLNDWVLVDMFARVVTGESDAEDSIRQAVRAARRYYK